MNGRPPVVTTYLRFEPADDAPVVTWAQCKCGYVLFSDSTQLPPADRKKPVLYFICPKCWHRVEIDSAASRRLRRDQPAEALAS